MKKSKTKTNKKRHLRVGRLLFLIFVLALICFLIIKFVDVPIRSIIIKGNNILSDQEIIEQAQLEDYPSYFSTFGFSLKNKLLKNPYIKNAKVTKGLLSIKITIEERKVLYIDKTTGNKVTEDKEINDDKIVCAPYLINEVPKDKQKKFINAMNKIDADILCQISEIMYDPNDIDADRYYLYMNDGNSVYLTVNKFSKINKYNTILENVGKQNGTLYLDYGDYFEVK